MYQTGCECVNDIHHILILTVYFPFRWMPNIILPFLYILIFETLFNKRRHLFQIYFVRFKLTLCFCVEFLKVLQLSLSWKSYPWRHDNCYSKSVYGGTKSPISDEKIHDTSVLSFVYISCLKKLYLYFGYKIR